MRTTEGMIALTGEEAATLRDLLAQAPAAHSAGETLAVSANASTSITFTNAEKAAVLDVLEGWLDPEDRSEPDGLLRLRRALARDLE